MERFGFIQEFIFAVLLLNQTSVLTLLMKMVDYLTYRTTEIKTLRSLKVNLSTTKPSETEEL